MDYYEILGVSKSSSQEEIKHAYKKLAREFHPDLHPEKKEESEEKLKQINEAYSVISDPQKRQSYDRFGSVGREGDFSGPFPGSIEDLFAQFGFGPGRQQNQAFNGQNIQTDLAINLFDALFGTQADLSFSLKEPCSACNATGAAKLDECSACSGKGFFVLHPNPNLAVKQACRGCNGSGKIPSERCTNCLGSGNINAKREYKITIPSGIKNGDMLRLRARGSPGINGGAPGDLIVRIAVSYPNIASIGEEEKITLKSFLTKE